jgi:hypothetical protein
MTNGPHGNEAEGTLDDLGEPIAELEGLEEDVSRGFVGRVLSALHRRSLVGQMATMAWTASAQAFFEFLGMLFSLFAPGEFESDDPEKEDRNGG